MQIVGTTSLPTLSTSLINCTFVSHVVHSLTVSFIADAIFLLPQYTDSHTCSLSLSLGYLALFPLLSIWYKTSGIHFLLINWINKFRERTVLISKVTPIRKNAFLYTLVCPKSNCSKNRFIFSHFFTQTNLSQPKAKKVLINSLLS